MPNRINLQLLISYLGLVPLIIIILDKFYFGLFNPYVLKDFSILYSIIIFVFIGAINWSLVENISFMQVLMGFLPSLLSVLIIILYLNSIDVSLLIITFLFCQLAIDNFLYKKRLEKKIFMIMRVPLTFSIIISLILIQL